MNSAPPADPDWTDKLEKERQEEIQVIASACEALGREIYEVRSSLHSFCDELFLRSISDDRSHQMGIVCSTPSRINSTY